MTGCTDTVPGPDHGWLAKVLSRDRLACGVLDLARTLPNAEWDAFAQRCEELAVVARVACCTVRLGV